MAKFDRYPIVSLVVGLQRFQMRLGLCLPTNMKVSALSLLRGPLALWAGHLVLDRLKREVVTTRCLSMNKLITIDLLTPARSAPGVLDAVLVGYESKEITAHEVTVQDESLVPP